MYMYDACNRQKPAIFPFMCEELPNFDDAKNSETSSWHQESQLSGCNMTVDIIYKMTNSMLLIMVIRCHCQRMVNVWFYNKTVPWFHRNIKLLLSQKLTIPDYGPKMYRLYNHIVFKSVIWPHFLVNRKILMFWWKKNA